MLDRARRRTAFGRTLAEYSTIQEWVALSRIEIEQSRLMVLKTAWLLDRGESAAARQQVSLIKVGVARAYSNIADRAVQVLGALGTTADTPAGAAYTKARLLRIYDGPDEVHYRTIYRLEAEAAAVSNRSFQDYMTPPRHRTMQAAAE